MTVQLANPVGSVTVEQAREALERTLGNALVLLPGGSDHITGLPLIRDGHVHCWDMGVEYTLLVQVIATEPCVAEALVGMKVALTNAYGDIVTTTNFEYNPADNPRHVTAFLFVKKETATRENRLFIWPD